MPSEIKAKFGTSTALNITLTPSGSGLASSTAGAGRQSDLVDNSTNRYQRVHVYFKVTTGTSPTGDKAIYFYLIKADKTSSANVITDGGGLTDANITIVSAERVHSVLTNSSSNQPYQGSFVINNPGPMWGIAVVHDTGVNLNSTSGNHVLQYVGENPESQ